LFVRITGSAEFAAAAAAAAAGYVSRRRQPDLWRAGAPAVNGPRQPGK